MAVGGVAVETNCDGIGHWPEADELEVPNGDCNGAICVGNNKLIPMHWDCPEQWSWRLLRMQQNRAELGVEVLA